MKEEVKEKVVAEKVQVTGSWLRTFLGNRVAGAIMDMPWDSAVLAGPHSPRLDRPLLQPPESPVWTPILHSGRTLVSLVWETLKSLCWVRDAFE